MRPSEILNARLDEVRATIARFPVANPRVFGSVARGQDREGSDIDILVDALDGADLFDLARLDLALEDLLGVKVDVATTGELRSSVATRIRRDERPL